MLKPIAIAFAVATVGLAGCTTAPAPEPVTDQNYGGKLGGSGAYVTRSTYRCPDWANVMHRGDLYCLKNR